MIKTFLSPIRRKPEPHASRPSTPKDPVLLEVHLEAQEVDQLGRLPRRHPDAADVKRRFSDERVPRRGARKHVKPVVVPGKKRDKGRLDITKNLRRTSALSLTILSL
jgi:hypothetical protein